MGDEEQVAQLQAEVDALSIGFVVIKSPEGFGDAPLSGEQELKEVPRNDLVWGNVG